jgi:hypothetical protein
MMQGMQDLIKMAAEGDKEASEEVDDEKIKEANRLFEQCIKDMNDQSKLTDTQGSNQTTQENDPFANMLKGISESTAKINSKP